MKIEFARMGGFAGIRLALSLDTEQLPEEEASRLSRLVESSGFFELELPAGGVTPQPDRFVYQIEIHSQVSGNQALALPENAMPEEIRPLIDHLTDLAMHQPRPHGPETGPTAPRA